MILSLKISNFILVKDLELNFANGLNVITGETGTGKSVIIGAINATFDKKTKKDVLLDASQKAYLEATFSIKNIHNELFEKYDIKPENNEIFISREFYPDNKRKSFINGRRVTHDIVAEFKDLLLDFHSQHNHLNYLNPDFQMHLLDLYSNNENLLESYKKLYYKIISFAKSLKDSIREEKEKADKIELYKYQLEELKQAQLTENEDEILEKELKTLTYAEDILNIFSEINYQFYESETSLYDIIYQKIHLLDNFSEVDIVKESLDYLKNIAENLDSLNNLTRNAEDIIFVDKERLEEITERLDLINELKSKYKKNSRELIEYQKEIETQINNFQTDKENIDKQKKELKHKINKLMEIAKQLSTKRKKYAPLFEEEICNNLKRLSIPDAQFKIKIDKKPISKEIFNGLEIPSLKGFDSVDFLFSANRGKDAKTLKSSASGGELSRIVLSIKKILAEKLKEKTLIFDEIDAGIGGKTAKVTGKFIGDISQKTQVICITHLAQIAAYADMHIKIDKVNQKNKTLIKIENLEKNKRILEIARMLSGNTSDSAINHAKEILNRKE